MKLLQTLTNQTKLTEDAAGGAVGGGGVTAGAIAATQYPLMKGVVRRHLWKGRKAKNAFRVGDVIQVKTNEAQELNVRLRAIEHLASIATPSAMREIIEHCTSALRVVRKINLFEDENFDPTEVYAKLKSLEAKEKVDKNDTVMFGLEDDDGNLVRVTVRNEQADDFEKALEVILARGVEGKEDQVPEIAEILFNLKDQYDIVDISWPDVVEDEEEEGQELAQQQDDQTGDEGQDEDVGDMVSDGEPPQDVDQATSLLTQVIDMMKADADARKADAHAKIADAKARETEAAVRQAEAKVKHEEEILDMETQAKQQKEEEKETKRLAQLAKWKHDMEKQSEYDDYTPNAVEPSTEEDEEISGGRMSPTDVARLLLKRVKP